MNDPRKSAFPPSVDRGTRLLILGSLPGDASIARGEYYAHRGNGFWRLMGDVVGEDLSGTPYMARLEHLRARGVGLWDVIESADRPGSLDSAIKGAALRDLAGFVATLPALEAIAFNGKMAALHGRRQLSGGPALTMIDLPSSSGAHATLTLAQKMEAWRVLRRWIV